MHKKGFLLVGVVFILLVLVSSQVLAGCCQGIIGCSRAGFSSECPFLSTFDTRECEAITECEIVACCHDQRDTPKATYRSSCMAMEPEPEIIPIKPFTTNPASEEATAALYCRDTGVRPACRNVNCELENLAECRCGSAVTDEGRAYCCARDNSVFPTQEACTVSPSCRAGEFYNVAGRVITPEGEPVSGAEVRAGGKSTITAEDGSYTIELLPDRSAGTVVAIKGTAINSTPYVIDGENVAGRDVVLAVEEEAEEEGEICDNGIDDDGDQFGWNSQAEGLGMTADRCDSNCFSEYGIRIERTVTKTYYRPTGERFTDSSGRLVDMCSDNYDNDCDGVEDCEDEECSDSPGCTGTYCGDGVRQYPNSHSQYEQCDYYNRTTGRAIVNATGHPIGDDRLCPGRCIPPGERGECTCRYAGGCGNNIIDLGETCDGIYNAARGRWESLVSGSRCTEAPGTGCGTPTSIRPCQCPPRQLCGNGIKEGPEQCDYAAEGTAGICPGEIDCNPDCTCPPREGVCGNNLLEPGEECDGTLDVEGFGWEEFTTRKFGCNRLNCAVPILEGTEIDDPAMPGYIGAGEEEGETERYPTYLSYLETIGLETTTDSRCTCPTNCRIDPPGPRVNKLGTTPFQRAITISWTDSCAAEARAYNVYRCEAENIEGEGCLPDDEDSDEEDEEGVELEYTVINAAGLGTEMQFTDTTFEGSRAEQPRYYCYYVEGVYDTLIPPRERDSRASFDPELHCIMAGMEQCFKSKENYPWATEFCADNVRSTCSATNIIIPVTPESPEERVNCNEATESFSGITSYICVGPYAREHEREGRTECVPRSRCDYCNDPFGLFGYSSDRGERAGDGRGRWDKTEFAPVTAFGEAPIIEPAGGERTEEERESRRGYVTCLGLDLCYMDYSDTSTNKFYTYDQNATCYDFNSLKACKEFNETIGGGGCEWQWHPLYKELGIGVCRTNITEEQECERCHDPLNEIFGRCDEQSCYLYGRCYYDEANPDIPGQVGLYAALAEMSVGKPKRAQREEEGKYYKCTHERNISCESYDNREDCVGSDSPYSLNGEDIIGDIEAGVGGEYGAEGVELDVFGQMRGRTFIKQEGTNEITARSDDFFSFGKCQWVMANQGNVTTFTETGEIEEIENLDEAGSQRCIKNSDDSPFSLHIEETRVEEMDEEILVARMESAEQYSDCKIFAGEGGISPALGERGEKIWECLKDLTEPITTIPHFGDEAAPMRIGKEFEFPAIVNDNSIQYSTHYPDTYACIAGYAYDLDEYLYCYPNQTAEGRVESGGKLITYDNIGVNVPYNFSEGFKSGIHKIRYFSEDISHNLEEVKEFYVFIDADAPNIQIIFSNRSYEISEDVWRTNLTLTMSIIPRADVAGDDTEAFCNASLYRGEAHIYMLQDIMNEYNSRWERTYTGLSDDSYTFRYTCIDDVGNRAEGVINFVIDGDRSITNPRPTGTLNTGEEIELSLETGTNAECRYREDNRDLPEFWQNRSFEPAVFAEMTRFEITGALEEPRTIHRTTINVEHGYHRYYTKCRMLEDGRIVGNNADQIRFAVDTEGPTTTHQTDIMPYNDWYNRDVEVELECGDILISGQGLEWSFGCNETYYCLGRDCATFEDTYVLYDDPITLTETTYLTYYSRDRGRNEGPVSENILFQIDKQAPNITIQFFDGEREAGVLVTNTVYRIRITSTEPFISPAVSEPTLRYTTTPSRFADSIELLPTENPAIWEGAFFLAAINANAGYEGEARFIVNGYDEHNVSATGEARIRVDTKSPTAPAIEPSLETPSPEASDYQQRGYPINYHNGTYYTRATNLFITGYTDDYLDMIAVKTTSEEETEHIFRQTPTNITHEDIVISGFEGRREIKIFGDLTPRINNEMYVGFDEEQRTIGPRTRYGSYGMFYDITSVVYHGGDDRYTSVNLFSPLEEALPFEREIIFYNKESPAYWFGLNIPLEAFKNTTLYLKAYDEAGNIIRYPPISREQPALKFFADPIQPRVIKSYPREGTTSRKTLQIGITAREGKQESGINQNTINITLNRKPVAFTVQHDLEQEAADPANNYYKIYHSARELKDGFYEVEVTAKDFAGNILNEETADAQWIFEVDTNIPDDPEFSLLGGFKGAAGDERWYARSTTGFIADFSAETNPVTITNIFDEEHPGERAASCENTSFNVFRCTFTEPKTSGGANWKDYGIVLRAYKTLDDETRSDEGSWLFRFTIDDTPPNFTPTFNRRFRDQIALTIYANVSNEKYPLKASIDILGARFAPLHTSNNGSFYYFIWNVPDYASEQEGATSMEVTLTDYAGNSHSVTIPVYIDLTPPRIEEVRITVSNTVEIGGELFTAQPNVTVSGRFGASDEDIYKVWLIKGAGGAVPGPETERAYASITYEERIPKLFDVSVKLIDPRAGSRIPGPISYGEMLISQINNMTLYASDTAGHVSRRRLEVMSDMVPPGEPRFCVGREMVECVFGRE
jgi:hypothetical protein